VQPLRRIRVTRYVTPLREGGSLPALVEADDDGLYVLKFRAAAQGVRVLVAELVAGSLARVLGLPLPELVLADVDTELARTEPDPEIHRLIYDSAGLNLAVDFLPGAVSYDRVTHVLDPQFAARVLWFDALVTNVDRTARNTNMLMWHRQPRLIDHGASMYFHHTPGWENIVTTTARAPFALISRHVLRAVAAPMAAVDEALAAVLTTDTIAGILHVVPDEWLQATASGGDAAAARAAYLGYFLERLTAPRPFLDNPDGH
jgi:hypothetical protein